MSASNTLLGTYLRDRRSKLDPVALGFPASRRRTPGLRREEVAQRANISATWYTWLEQGRGGGASADVLDRLARGLMLTEVEREHLFLLGLGRLPEAREQDSDDVSPRLQRVLDALEPSAAMIKNGCWDVLAWNNAARVLLCDYNALPLHDRNILRQMFLNPAVREAQQSWEGAASFVVAAFRADITRLGLIEKSQPLIDELSALSADFRRMWRDNDVRNFGGGVKHMRHPQLGAYAVEYSAFAVDGRPDLAMMVYNPLTAEDASKIRDIIAVRVQAEP